MLHNSRRDCGLMNVNDVIYQDIIINASGGSGIGSSVASSLTSQSGRSGTDPSMHSNSYHRRNSRPIHHSTGVPVGLLRASKSPDVNSLRRSRSRSSSFCASLAGTTISPSDHGNVDVLMNPPNPQCVPNFEQFNHWAPQRAGMIQDISKLHCLLLFTI
ncbi:unnamed protein product [Rodentolepis nana]|uniref:Uncharacterized protein n=1 Tax=Rodentolepis nana TaxID=102285 RepID=A0A0R3T902_RODNA|nr:unnamed protein product [Rodentolepis nana]